MPRFVGGGLRIGLSFDGPIYFSSFFVQNHNIMREYVKYYNLMRPHQGIDNLVPCSSREPPSGKIKKKSAVFGLYTTYYREAS